MINYKLLKSQKEFLEIPCASRCGTDGRGERTGAQHYDGDVRQSRSEAYFRDSFVAENIK